MSKIFFLFQLPSEAAPHLSWTVGISNSIEETPLEVLNSNGGNRNRPDVLHDCSSFRYEISI
jgi:hypothetical protein